MFCYQNDNDDVIICPISSWLITGAIMRLPYHISEVTATHLKIGYR